MQLFFFLPPENRIQSFVLDYQTISFRYCCLHCADVCGVLLKIPFEEIEPAKVKESVGVWEYGSMGVGAADPISSIKNHPVKVRDGFLSNRNELKVQHHIRPQSHAIITHLDGIKRAAGFAVAPGCIFSSFSCRNIRMNIE